MFVSLWVRAPDRNGPNTIDLLFYYENAESDPGLGYVDDLLLKNIFPFNMQIVNS